MASARQVATPPLRYPGGKGKLSKFMAAIVRANGLSDGRYIEPYAGGAGIAWELLITGSCGAY